MSVSSNAVSETRLQRALFRGEDLQTPSERTIRLKAMVFPVSHRMTDAG